MAFIFFYRRRYRNTISAYRNINMSLLNFLHSVVFTLVACISVSAQSYKIKDDKLSVDSRNWQQWFFPHGCVDFSYGGVQPTFIRDRTNAVLNANLFRSDTGIQGGIRSAGTNLQEAAYVIDGRDDTFWEPDASTDIGNWWLEINLGRLVWAQKVVVKFVGINEGDPFLQFQLLTSNGEPAFLQSESLKYLRAGRSEGLNKTQRLYEFELTPTSSVDPGISGRLIQFLQIVATASHFGRAEEIDLARWSQLSEREQGDVVYSMRESSGILREIDHHQYESLADSDRQGPVKYYRREQPRLAEVEVWTAGDNISLGALDRGGGIVGYGNLGAEVLTIDGDWNSFWSIEVGFSSNDPTVVFQDPHRSIFFDLGAWYWLNRTSIAFGSGQAFPNYAINLSDGSRSPDGSLSYTLLTARGQEGVESTIHRGILFHDNIFTLTKTRYLKIDYTLVEGSARPAIRELQLYGQGFLPQVTLNSGIVELGDNPRIASKIAWKANTPPNTEIRLRSRTGNQLQKEVRYFTNTGLEVTEEKYRKLLSFQRGDSTTTVIPGEDWSPWSQYYLTSGTAITSPSPRRYMMIETTLVSEDPNQAARLLSLDIDLETPLASEILGEISPTNIQQQGIRSIFTLFLKPRFQEDSRGFDQVLLKLPSGMNVELMDLTVGTEEELRNGIGQHYEFDQIDKIATGPDSLWVQLPKRISRKSAVIALRFNGTLYLAGNTFVVQIGLGRDEKQIWQRVDSGDATTLNPSGGLTVFTPFTNDVLGEVEVMSNPFTPNGDGINEFVELIVPVFKLLRSSALVLNVYSLDGRRVRSITRSYEPAVGMRRITWDGRDDNGRLMPPGLYVCRVFIDVDAERGLSVVNKLVHSVY